MHYWIIGDFIIYIFWFFILDTSFSLKVHMTKVFFLHCKEILCSVISWTVKKCVILSTVGLYCLIFFSFHRIMPISWSMFILWLLKFQNLGYHRRTLVGLWINLAVGERWVSSFFLLHVDIQFFSTTKDDMRSSFLQWSFKGLSKSVAVAMKICYCVLYPKTPIYNSGFVLPPAVSNAMAPRYDMKFGFVLLLAYLLFTVSITA